MTYAELPADFRSTCEHVCTPRELDVVKLRFDGYSWNRITESLGVSRSTIKGRYRNALRKIELARKDTPSTTITS
jgi:DNA-binding NarL/FixJ family response regulator